LDQVNQDDDVLPSNLEEEKTPGNKQEQLSQPEIPVSDQANNTQGDGVQLSNPEKEKTPEQEQLEVSDQKLVFKTIINNQVNQMLLLHEVKRELL
ncbi:MAG: hypothetical protein KTM48_02090, partial [Wolbachia endosymbiont of Pissodes strobi]|nr:hypothetical protein [Wolbachia endosymbiont of Pissodes strobi]